MLGGQAQAARTLRMLLISLKLEKLWRILETQGDELTLPIKMEPARQAAAACRYVARHAPLASAE